MRSAWTGTKAPMHEAGPTAARPLLTSKRETARRLTDDDIVPVLVPDGSLVGLSMAVFLGRHGIPASVEAVRRHDLPT